VVKRSLRRAVELLKGHRVLVLGDLMLDRYIVGDVRRISPEAPVPVVRAERESELPGGAGNVAANVVALGARCHLIGIVGDDPEGEALREVAESAGVASAGLVADPTRPTTVKPRRCLPMVHATALTYFRSAWPSGPIGVPTQMKQASAPSKAVAASVVKSNRPAWTLSSSNSPSPGS